jgi:hypothetical protein
VRVVSWNIAFRGPKAAKLQGGLLRELAPDLMLLQELNPGSSTVLADAAGADWMVRAIDLRTPEPDDSPVRGRGVAIAGHGLHPAVRGCSVRFGCPSGSCSSRHRRRERRLSR